MPYLQVLRSDHASDVLEFELANRLYFADFITDRGDVFFEEFTTQFSELLSERERRRDAYFVLVEEDGSVLGRFNLYGMDGELAELGYRMAERASGKGLATAGVRALCRLAVSDHGLRRLRARTTRENVASQRVLLKAGFAPDGEIDVAGRPGIWYERELTQQ